MIRIVIADDQELIRESLKIILSTHKDVEIVGVAADGFEVESEGSWRQTSGLTNRNFI